MSFTPEIIVINKMFEAFKRQDLNAALETVSDDTIWIHHGTRKLPYIRFEGRSGAKQFFHTNFTTMKVEYFNILRMIQNQETVIVFGEEKFIMASQDNQDLPTDQGPLQQQWVQIYTVKDNLITRMEEYATSALANEYIVVN